MSAKTTKLLKWGKLHDIRFDNFLKMMQKAQTTKEKIDKLDFNKIENFSTSKDTINRVKRQSTGWEKIFANHISDMALISRIYKYLLQLNNKNKTLI